MPTHDLLFIVSKIASDKDYKRREKILASRDYITKCERLPTENQFEQMSLQAT